MLSFTNPLEVRAYFANRYLRTEGCCIANNFLIIKSHWQESRVHLLELNNSPRVKPSTTKVKKKTKQKNEKGCIQSFLLDDGA
jgi:hypothetical protein